MNKVKYKMDVTVLQEDIKLIKVIKKNVQRNDTS